MSILKIKKEAVIYISGGITGIDDAEERFENAAKQLKLLGFDKVINPIIEQYIGVFTYDEWIEHGIWLLDKCDAIYMMKGWKESKGAKIEYIYACGKGLLVLGE